MTSSAVRLDLTSPAPGTDAGFLQIAELEVMGIPVAYNATASLASLEVNGAPVSGFDPTGLEYQVTVGPGIPQVAAVPADTGASWSYRLHRFRARLRSSSRRRTDSPPAPTWST